MLIHETENGILLTLETGLALGASEGMVEVETVFDSGRLLAVALVERGELEVANFARLDTSILGAALDELLGGPTQIDLFETSGVAGIAAGGRLVVVAVFDGEEGVLVERETEVVPGQNVVVLALVALAQLERYQAVRDHIFLTIIVNQNVVGEVVTGLANQDSVCVFVGL